MPSSEAAAGKKLKAGADRVQVGDCNPQAAQGADGNVTDLGPKTVKTTVVVVGAGASGVGLGALLAQCNVAHVIVDRARIGESFLTWPKETRFISPSFTGNFFGCPDLNAVTPHTSPAYTLQSEHPTGTEYAKYLNDVARHFGLNIKTNTNVLGIDAPRAEDKPEAASVVEMVPQYVCCDDVGIGYRTKPEREARLDDEGENRAFDLCVVPGQVVGCISGPVKDSEGTEWIETAKDRWVPLSLDGDKMFEPAGEAPADAPHIVQRGIDPIAVYTDDGTERVRYEADFLIWAGGEFQFPNSLPNTVRGGESYTKLPVGKHVIIGGSESGMDATYHLIKNGSTVTMLDSNAPWDQPALSDSSNGLSPHTLGRLREIKASGKVTFIAERADTISATEVVTKNHGRIELENPAFDATGFDTRKSVHAGLFKYDAGGCATVPVISKVDESTVARNVYLAGPTVRHDKAIFCFIYKYRQRWAVVVRDMLEKMGRTAAAIEEYQKKGFLLDDLSCCGDECAC